MVQANAINAGSTGFQSFNGTGTFAGRTLTPGTGISITNQNGVGGDPVISATGGFTPNSAVMIQDDFIGSSMSSTADTVLTSDQSWVQSFLTNIVVLDSGHPGNISNAIFAIGNTAYMKMGFNGGVPAPQPQIILGGGVLTINWVFNIAILSNVTNTYTLKIGMLNANDHDGFYFAYSNALNSGNWTINSIKANTPTTTNTATAVTTGWHNAQMVVNAAASSIAFTIDGVSQGSISTNIPIVEINPGVTATCSAGTIAAQSFYFDLMYLVQTLTTAR